MSKVLITCALLFLCRLASGQSITIEPLSDTAFCTGEVIIARYSEAGGFNADNRFVLQMSDPNGSFGTFSNVAIDSVGSGSFNYTASATGDHLRFRVISTSPYLASSDNGRDILIQGYPAVTAEVHRPGRREMQQISLVGAPVQFVATANSGDSVLWEFPSDATPQTSTERKPFISFATAGIKWARLTATNRAGCSRTDSISILIAGCHPTIPAGTRIVTGVEVGAQNDKSVLVKTGASYTVASFMQTIFVEPGAVVKGSPAQYLSLVYLMTGASEQFDPHGDPANFVLGKDAIFGAYDDALDTVRCNDLTFDYSQLTNGVALEVNTNQRVTIDRNGTLSWPGLDPLQVEVLSILGDRVASGQIDINHQLSLSTLPRGSYVVRAIDRRVSAIRVLR